MIWGLIAGNSLGPMLVFDQGVTVDGDVYRERVVPLTHDFKA